MGSEPNRGSPGAGVDSGVQAPAAHGPPAVGAAALIPITFLSRVWLFYKVLVDQSTAQLVVRASSEQRRGQVLTLRSRAQHTVAGWPAVPHLLTVKGMLKQKESFREGEPGECHGAGALGVLEISTLYGTRCR